MTLKQWTLVAGAVLLGGISVYLNTDWFSRDSIQITHRSRPVQIAFAGRNRQQPQTGSALFFEFDRKLKLTDVQVIPYAEIETNKYPHPVWHLVSDSNSLPTLGIMYGNPVPGMRPSVKGALPDPLTPGVKYQLRVQAGSTKASHDFVPAL